MSVIGRYLWVADDARQLPPRGNCRQAAKPSVLSITWQAVIAASLNVERDEVHSVALSGLLEEFLR